MWQELIFHVRVAVPFLMHYFSVISEIITINHHQKLDSLSYIFVADSMGLTSTTVI